LDHNAVAHNTPREELICRYTFCRDQPENTERPEKAIRGFNDVMHKLPIFPA
jgi:hypothetical protein